MRQIKILFIFMAVFTALGFSQPANDSIPQHRNIKQGVLQNGIKYYILPNKQPEKKAELRLVILSGSLNEREDQRGLAHFVEHMLFNGTKNFPGNKVVDFLEILGMKFGPEINAYTSTEETVYMLTVPTDRNSILDSAFLILSDWAVNATFDSLEIDKERGVVLEEMRMGKGAAERIRDKQFPVLFHNSRFAERLPIGKEEILKNFPHKSLTDYYKEWYKPELMSVVAVGDFDATEIEKLVHKHFNTIPGSSLSKKRVIYGVPDHKERLYTITGDKEVTTTSLTIVHKRPVLKANTKQEYKNALVFNLISMMLNERLFDLSKKVDAPFLEGGGYTTGLSYDKGAFVLYMTPKENMVDSSFFLLNLEAEKMRQFGFNFDEFGRSIENMNAGMDNYFKEKENQYSNGIVNAILDQVINDAIYTDIEYGYTIYKELIPTISLEEVNQAAKSLTTDSNLVVMISYPEKEGIRIPSEEELEKIYTEVKKVKLSGPTVVTTDRPLIKEEPTPGKIVSEEDFGILDIKKWTLDNGAVVYLKKTALQQDEVMMYGFSKGGLSKVEDSDLVSAKYSNNIIEESGLGDFNLTDLSKKLSGKMVSLTTGISDLSESIQGKSSLKDIEDFFRLIYLTFTNPRLDTEASDIFLEKMKNYLQNAGMSPDNVFYDTIVVSLFGNNPRMKPMSIDQLNQLDPAKAFSVFKERFNSASDFEFVFVGNFDEDIMRSLVSRYIASQPKVSKENWIDRGVRYANKSEEKTVKMGTEQKATVFLSFPGKFEWTKKNAMELTTLQKIFDIQLNEVIREELGGSYSVSASTTYNKYPEPVFNNSVYFNCDPARIAELVSRVIMMIDSLKTSFKDETTLLKAKENQYKEIDDTFQDNSSILNLISSYLMFDADLNDFFAGKDFVKAITVEDIRNAAKKYFNGDVILKYYLKPFISK